MLMKTRKYWIKKGNCMKIKLIFLICALFFSSVYASNKKETKVVKSTYVNHNLTIYRIIIFEIDKHEYIYINSEKHAGLTHKANCKECEKEKGKSK